MNFPGAAGTTAALPTPDRTPPCFYNSSDCLFQPDMDVLPMCSIFQELQIVHETGYFSALPSLVIIEKYFFLRVMAQFTSSSIGSKDVYLIVD